VHLTNYALNKDNENFRQAESVQDATSHKRTITTVLREMREGPNPIDTELMW